MRREDILALTRVQPFQPFRVYLTIGETYDIRHPDLILATLGTAHIAAPSPGQAPDDLGSVRIVSLVHVMKIEFIQPSVQPSNGVA